MDLEFLNEVKKRVIIAMFSDDDLMEHLVLKGGNLLDMVYGISTRPSKDVDFSIPGKFADLMSRDNGLYESARRWRVL